MFKIGIVDTDEIFISRLKEVFECRFPDEFEIIYFPNLKKAQTAAEKTDLAALLTNHVHENDLITIPRQCKTALLTENRASLKVLSVPAVCKYQSIDEWHEFLTALCKGDGFSVKGGENTRPRASEICLFSSTGGGVGAPAAAAAFCVCCAAKGKSVVYLNFETLCSTERFFFGEGKFDFDDVIYALRSKKYELAPVLQKAIVRDARGVGFIKPCKVIPDAFSITGEEIVRICETIQGFDRFDLIVVDMNFESTENIVLPFLKSKRTILVTDGSINANAKLEKILEALPLISGKRRDKVIGKVAVLYNRFVTGVSETYENPEITRVGGITVIDAKDESELISKIATEFPMQKLCKEFAETEDSL